MQRIEKSDMDLALKVFSWLLRAQRVLRMDELLEVLVVEEGDTHLEREGMLRPSEVVECCKSLVLYEECSGLVRFTHETVQDFIANNVQQSLLSTVDLAKTCLTYLGFDDLKEHCPNASDFDKRLQEHTFLHYASRYWDVHVREAEENSDVQSYVSALLSTEPRRNSITQLETYSHSNWLSTEFAKNQTLLHVAAEKGFASLCRTTLAQELRSNERLEFTRIAAHF